jgi:RHS repeat-associated protein
MSMRALLPAVIGSLIFLPALSQSYQASFTEVKFDRAKTPTVIHGGASVDVPTGALSFDVPTGPGVGPRGMRFIPRLTSRFGPQTPPFQAYASSGPQSQVSPGGSSCTFTPGYLVRGYSLVDDEFLLPDGTSGGRTFTDTTANPMQIVSDFGLAGVTSAVVNGVGSQGELVIDLYGPGAYAPITLYAWQPTRNYPCAEYVTVPRGMLVLSADGSTVTEFRYLNPQYTAYFAGSPSPAAAVAMTPLTASASAVATGTSSSKAASKEGALALAAAVITPTAQNDLKAIHYLPVGWRNRFGDLITFNHTPNGGTGNGVDYDATWTRNGSTGLASAQVRLQGMPAVAAVPAINTGGGVNNQVSSGGRIQVSYTGASHGTYTLDALAPYGTPVNQTNVAWGRALAKPWDAFRRNLQPYRLSVDSTGEFVQFDYAEGTTVNNLILPVTLKSLTFPFRKQTFTWQPYKYRRPEGQFAYSSNPNARDVYTSGGITQVLDQDLTGGGQARVTTYERVVPVPNEAYNSGPYWTSTAFWVAVTHPDDQVAVTRFAEPLNGIQIDYTKPANAYQSAAHLKHLPVDARAYAAGKNWRLDLGILPSQSVAYRVTQYGAMPTGALGSAQGEASRFAVGPTWVNPYWNFACAFNSAGNLGPAPYCTRQESWEKDDVGAVRRRVETRSNWDTVGRGWQTQTISAEDENAPLSRTTTQAYQSDQTHWFLGRLVRQQKPGQAPVAFTYNPDNTLQKATVNAGSYPEVTTNLTYAGHPEPTSATLTSPHLAQSGLVGASYGFDRYGLISSITPYGVGWNLEETHDAFGRATQQSGANAEVTSIQWDPAGRLASLQPNPESASVVSYPDLLTAVVTRGQQQTTHHYNGFGELVKTDRQGGSQVFQYDLAGRKLFESVWGSFSTGTTFGYDGHGRVALVTDPNGEVTQTRYEGPKRRVTHGGIGTQFISDALGQPAQVIDPLGQATSYGHDEAGRVIWVQQTGTTGTQVRTWHYNPLGWLDQVTQPESGTTTYSSFTVQGKAQVTDYNGRPVMTTYDSLGRVTTQASADGSVSQSLVYGEQELGHGSANNKLVRATVGGISRNLDYFGLRGRLSQLTRSVDGLNFSQAFGYESTYGLLVTRLYPDGSIQKINYDWVKGMPTSSGFGGNPSLTDLVANLTYHPVSWSVTRLAYANGAYSTFSYDPDQVRLKTMAHNNLPDPSVNKVWAYTYDAAGRLTGDSEDRYGYDALGRLTSAFVWDPFNGSAGQGILQQFSYDAFGNRYRLDSKNVTNWAAGVEPPPIGGAATLPTAKAQTYAMTGSERSQLAATNRLPGSIGGVATGADYDPQGNLTRFFGKIGNPGTLLTMTYDSLGRVTGLGDTGNATSQTYRYDDEGLRMRTTDSRSGVTTYSIYNEARQLVATYTRTGSGSLTWKKDIVYLGAKEVAELDAAGTEITLVDHLGSPRFAWRGGSSALAKQKFLPFGESLAAPAEAAAFAKGFTNHEQTDASGLIYMQARFYAPWYGRFLSPDPVRDQHFEETQSWNIYSYCKNMPTMKVDPDGMKDDWYMSSTQLQMLPRQQSSSAGSLGKPIASPTASYKTGGRAFGSPRDGGRTHAGADLLAPKGSTEAVYAVKGGVVASDAKPFYSGTFAAEVKNSDGTVLRYGEIGPNLAGGLKPGSPIAPGQQLGNLQPNNKDGNSMLHLEEYKGTESGPLTQKDNGSTSQRRSDLKDVTPLLDKVYATPEEKKKDK